MERRGDKGVDGWPVRRRGVDLGRSTEGAVSPRLHAASHQHDRSRCGGTGSQCGGGWGVVRAIPFPTEPRTSQASMAMGGWFVNGCRTGGASLVPVAREASARADRRGARVVEVSGGTDSCGWDAGIILGSSRGGRRALAVARWRRSFRLRLIARQGGTQVAGASVRLRAGRLGHRRSPASQRVRFQALRQAGPLGDRCSLERRECCRDQAATCCWRDWCKPVSGVWGVEWGCVEYPDGKALILEAVDEA